MFKGPRLIDEVARLLREQNYSTRQVSKEFGVGPSWYSDFRRGRTHKPDADKLQEIYEALADRPLIKD